jgi:hypothetical protein
MTIMTPATCKHPVPIVGVAPPATYRIPVLIVPISMAESHAYCTDCRGRTTCNLQDSCTDCTDCRGRTTCNLQDSCTDCADYDDIDDGAYDTCRLRVVDHNDYRGPVPRDRPRQAPT